MHLPVSENRLDENGVNDGVKKTKIGGCILASRPLFSHDSKHIFINRGSELVVYSVRTGLYVKRFDVGDKKICSIVLYENSPACVTTDGTIFILTSNTFDLKESRTLYAPSDELNVLHAMYVKTMEYDWCLAMTSKSSDIGHVVFVKTSKGALYNEFPVKFSVQYFSEVKMAHGNRDFPMFCIIVNKKILEIYLNNKKKSIHCSGMNVEWTCVRCRSSLKLVAAGDSLGRITLFTITVHKDINLFTFVKTDYHWHHLQCNDVLLTDSGSTMYSGGTENVLVKWNLSTPHTKNFLPRLSSIIVYISISKSCDLLALAISDNSIHLVHASNLEMHSQLQQTSWFHRPIHSAPFPAGLRFDPRTKSILLNAREGQLQLYSPQSDNVVEILDVTMQNYLAREEFEGEMLNTDVTCVDLSDDGTWLVTVESRALINESTEIKMKMWNYVQMEKVFQLTTVIQFPHDDFVKCVKFKPGSTTLLRNDADDISDYMIVSTGGDRKARIWSPLPSDSIYRKALVWECQSSCHYRNLECGPCRFSEDGSLLAIGFGSILTLWDTDKVSIKESLSRSGNPLTFIEFGRNECCHLIMVTTNEEVYVWDLLTLSLIWQVQKNVKLLVADRFSSYMAIFTDNQLLIFNPAKKEAVFSKYNITDSPVVASLFVPRDQLWIGGSNWLSNSHLYIANSNQEIFRFENNNETAEVNVLMSAGKEEFRTVYASLLSTNHISAQLNADNHSSTSIRQIPSVDAINQFVNAAAHSLPPLTSICGNIIDSLLIRNKVKAAESLYENDKSALDSESEVKVTRKPEKRRVDKESSEILRSSANVGNLRDLFPEIKKFFDNEKAPLTPMALAKKRVRTDDTADKLTVEENANDKMAQDIEMEDISEFSKEIARLNENRPDSELEQNNGLTMDKIREYALTILGKNRKIEMMEPTDQMAVSYEVEEPPLFYIDYDNQTKDCNGDQNQSDDKSADKQDQTDEDDDDEKSDSDRESGDEQDQTDNETDSEDEFGYGQDKTNAKDLDGTGVDEKMGSDFESGDERDQSDDDDDLDRTGVDNNGSDNESGDERDQSDDDDLGRTSVDDKNGSDDESGDEREQSGPLYKFVDNQDVTMRDRTSSNEDISIFKTSNN